MTIGVDQQSLHHFILACLPEKQATAIALETLSFQGFQSFPDVQIVQTVEFRSDVLNGLNYLNVLNALGRRALWNKHRVDDPSTVFGKNSHLGALPEIS